MEDVRIIVDSLWRVGHWGRLRGAPLAPAENEPRKCNADMLTTMVD